MFLPCDGLFDFDPVNWANKQLLLLGSFVLQDGIVIAIRTILFFFSSNIVAGYLSLFLFLCLDRSCNRTFIEIKSFMQ